MHVLGELSLQLYLTRSSQSNISKAESKIKNMVSMLGNISILSFFSLNWPSDLISEGQGGVWAGGTFRLKNMSSLGTFETK